MSEQYAVFGNPIGHSKSPQIHQAFAAQCAVDMDYQARLVATGHFDEAAADFFCSGGKGLNITVPFKMDAFNFAAQLTERARRAGAVNTLIAGPDGSVLGDTTDGVGMVRDIVGNHHWQLRDKKVLILGAGGAVRGVIEPLLTEAPQCLVIANRTVSKADDLATLFNDLGKVTGCGFEQLQDRQFDVVINGTSASLAGDLPPLPDTLLVDGACCYDMMYAAEPTVFLRWGAKHGAAKIVDGLGMLVEQAAESFFLWRGVRPETAAVIKSIRAQLQDSLRQP